MQHQVDRIYVPEVIILTTIFGSPECPAYQMRKRSATCSSFANTSLQFIVSNQKHVSGCYVSSSMTNMDVLNECLYAVLPSMTVNTEHQHQMSKRFPNPVHNCSKLSRSSPLDSNDKPLPRRLPTPLDELSPEHQHNVELAECRAVLALLDVAPASYEELNPLHEHQRELAECQNASCIPVPSIYSTYEHYKILLQCVAAKHGVYIHPKVVVGVDRKQVAGRAKRNPDCASGDTMTQAIKLGSQSVRIYICSRPSHPDCKLWVPYGMAVINNPGRYAGPRSGGRVAVIFQNEPSSRLIQYHQNNKTIKYNSYNLLQGSVKAMIKQILLQVKLTNVYVNTTMASSSAEECMMDIMDWVWKMAEHGDMEHAGSDDPRTKDTRYNYAIFTC
jgi:hypothetical protein